MPIKIIELQRRFAEQGRIRLGYQASTESGGKRPAKLDKFRFTSTSEQHIRDLATLYGGDPRAWDNSGKAEWEVYSETKSIPVFVVKGGLTQWLEFWSGGGCIHRCDGETNQLTGQPCDLEEKVKTRVRGKDVYVNPHTEAKPTTRLSMMLPELESIGVWRLESHGWNAAVEIPAVAELAQFVGDLVPAGLDLVERRSIKDGKTSRFVVPVLDLKIATHRLREIVEAKVNGTPMLESPAGAGGRPALESGSGGDDAFAPFFAKVAATKVVDDLAGIWNEARDAGLVGTGAADTERAREFLATWKAKAHELKPAADAEPDADGAFDIEVVDDPQVIWERIMKVGGDRGYSLPDIEDDFTQKMGGLQSAEASAAELQAYLGQLEAVPAA